MNDRAHRLTGQLALVVGASRGVGRAYTLALVAAGAHVVATARSVAGDAAQIGSLAEVVAAGRELGGRVTALACDLTDEASIVRAVEQTVANFGGADILVNNAKWGAGRFDPLAVPEDEWTNTMNVNVRGAYVFMREVVPTMVARGGGSIVNITSAAAGVTQPGSGAHDGVLAYGVSKAALERLTTYFAAEYADRNLAVNALSPGNVARYMESGREPDLRYWGEPLVHLAEQRSETGMTGRVLHTYEFGRSWGPAFETPPEWDDDIVAMLSEAGALERRD
jgi:NAD(P)-dependent dehydrogenase (short-subunit alcohol dehydrogenase family)